MWGQFLSTLIPGIKRAAAIIGSAAFFDPWIVASPYKGAFPLI